MILAAALVTDDAVVLGLLLATLGIIFHAAQSPRCAAFFRYVPALLLCYFVPALYNTAGIVDGSTSQLYFVASRFLLPATLALLTLSIDFGAVAKLGPKAIVMFLTGSLGVVVGGPLTFLVVGLVSPETVSGDTWRGFTAVAGSWIGGGANQAAMKEVFEIPDDLFGTMVAVDVVAANLWLALLLWMAARADRLDARRGADTSAIEALKERVQAFERAHARNPTLTDLAAIAGVGFGVMGLSHAAGKPLAAWIGERAPGLADYSLDSSFFWIVVLSTTLGLALSFTRARTLEGAGASKVGQLLLYVLVATIGMSMDLAALVERPELFLVGLLWISFHGGLMLLVAQVIRAPTFFIAVGSQANIGGAASAPVVASAFHPSLAPVGVLLAVLGYALGTYGAYLCGQLLRLAAS